MWIWPLGGLRQVPGMNWSVDQGETLTHYSKDGRSGKQIRTPRGRPTSNTTEVSILQEDL